MDSLIDALPWLLVIHLWSDPPPKMQFIYKKEYPSYQECMRGREEWIKVNNPPPDFKVLCLLK